MGIFIDLYRIERVPYYESIRHKLQYSIDAIKFFHGALFKLENVEIWIGAPSETLGGKLMRRIQEAEPYMAGKVVSDLLMTLPFDEISESIVMFNGVWNFGDINLGGYFSVPNSYSWRKAYHEIEINAYAKKDFEDLVDALWKTMPHETTPLVQKFIKTLQQTTARSGKLGLSQVLFSIGVPTVEDPTNLMAAFLTGERKGLLRIFYKALSKTRDPKVVPPEVVSKTKPLRGSFFVNTLGKEEIVLQRLSQEIESALVVEIKGDSALYIAKDRKSFAKLYKEISDTVLKPGLEELPTAKDATELIEKGLKEYTEPQ